ncbi:uncharacterized protein LOC119729666 isoform X2 [Patiria miniata]|uniref:Deleted in malignant brain tumors 1 protein-like n=1 Tax=Patiria miniata TaxID=46514 RepID=A0A914A3L2_PATMI|nr:uncharacterized protein LOC119729666 isoform X2 [Patiria miniata]
MTSAMAEDDGERHSYGGHSHKMVLMMMLFLAAGGLQANAQVSPQDEYPVRLVGGVSETEGRVEILFNGEWGTVCDEGWDYADASVVCRQLGLYGPNTSIQAAFFGEGTGHVLMAHVGCHGNESHLSDCAFTGWGFDSCQHNRDASVSCQIAEEFPVRLAGGSTERDGQVEVYYRDQWQAMLVGKWKASVGSVICRELGYHGPNMSYTEGPASGGLIGPGYVYLDDMSCDGSEEKLNDCTIWSIGGPGVTGLIYQTVVRVSCQTEDEDFLSVRLVEGLDSSQGSLEVYFDGHWGVIRETSWDDAGTGVVCRQLGFDGPNVTLYSTSFFGRANLRDPAFFSIFRCRGDEAMVSDCPRTTGSGDLPSYQSLTVGIICQAVADHPVRLVGEYNSTNAGLVEMFFHGHWVAVQLKDGSESAFASVICRQLGLFGPNMSTISHSAFSTHRRTYTYGMRGVACNGTESRLVDCTFEGWANMYRGVGVVCQAVDDHPVRLTGGSSSTEGKVEVFMNGQWGAVCADGWDTSHASVVCRQLGFHGPNTSLHYPKEEDQLQYLTSVTCQGQEERLVDCDFKGWGAYCTTLAAVKCQTDEEYPIRLADGSSSSEGRVEVFFNGQWGTICDTNWDDAAASVVCRQLGFPGPSLGVRQALFGRGDGPKYLKNVDCEGHEEQLTDCSFEGWAIYPYLCSRVLDAGVICQADEDFPVRLVDGPTLTSGRVELFFHGQWGTVCDSRWDDLDAAVVCRQLGFNGSSIAVSGSFFGQGQGPAFLSHVDCSGNESRLSDCIHVGLGSSYCSHRVDAGVICQADDSFHVRLADGPSHNVGRVEIYFNDQWGTVCRRDWDAKDATVVCNQLGFHGTGRPVYASIFGRGNGPYIMNEVDCDGTERRLADCRFSGWGKNKQSCDDTVGVVCSDLFGSTCPPPETFIDHVDGQFTIRKYVIKDMSTASDASWTEPVLVNMPENYVNSTTCTYADGRLPPGPCRSGGSFNITRPFLVREETKHKVEYRITDLDESVTYSCIFYISVAVVARPILINIPVFRDDDDQQESPSTSIPEPTTASNQGSSYCHVYQHYDPVNGFLTWPFTRAGEQAESSQRCPPGSDRAGMPKGIVNCSSPDLHGNDARWEAPVMVSCNDNTSEEEVSQAEIMLGQIGNNDEFLARQLDEVVDILDNITSLGSGDLQVTEAVIGAVDSIMNAIRGKEVLDQAHGKNLAILIQSINQQVSSSLRQGGEISIQKNSIHVKAISAPPSVFQDRLSFVSETTGDSGQQGLPLEGGNSTLVGSEVKVYQGSSEIPSDGRVKAVISLPANLEELMQGFASPRINVTFIIYADDTMFPSSLVKASQSENQSAISVAGPVVSLAVEGITLVNLTEPIAIEFKTSAASISDRATCVFWDFTLENGVGDWSSAGCEFQGVTNGRYTCQCDHATNFAVLVRQGDSAYEVEVIGHSHNLFNQISCIGSAGTYLIIIVVYLTVTKLRVNKSGQIFLQFVFSLLMLYAVFFAGAYNARSSSIRCVAVSALLHFLPLTTVMWTAVEARFVYTRTLKISSTESSLDVVLASLVAWGIPFVMTGTAVALAVDQYNNEDYCIVAPSLLLYFGLLQPIGLILIHNFITFAMAMCNLSKPQDEEQPIPSSSSSVTKQLLADVIICTLLAVAILSGFMSVHDHINSQIYSVVFLASSCLLVCTIGAALYLKTKDAAPRRDEVLGLQDISDFQEESQISSQKTTTDDATTSCGAKLEKEDEFTVKKDEDDPGKVAFEPNETKSISNEANEIEVESLDDPNSDMNGTVPTEDID